MVVRLASGGQINHDNNLLRNINLKLNFKIL